MENKYDLLLVIAPPWGVKTPPVGIAYLAQYLKKQDVRVKILDLNICLFNKLAQSEADLWHPGNKVFWVIPDKFKAIEGKLSAAMDEMVNEILTIEAPLIGFSVFSDNRLFSNKLMERIKRKDNFKKIIAGGVGCYSQEERDSFAENLVDHFVIGEGEQALLNIVTAYRQGRQKSLPPVYETQTKLNLNEFPFPTYEDFNLADYTDESLALSFSRGCPMQCVYCNDRYVMGKYREKTPQNMLEELSYHKFKNNIAEFAINDLQINANLQRLESFLDLLIERKLAICWTANMMPRHDMSKALIAKIKQAGCTSVIFGVESGSDKVLKLMKRQFCVDDSEKLLASFAQAGLPVWVNFIVGFPGESEEDFLMTLDFIRRNKAFISKVSVLNKCNIVKGSDLYNKHKDYHVFWSKQKEYEEVRWATSEGNAEVLRDLRLQRIIIELTDLNIELLQSNVKYADPLLNDEQLYKILGTGHSFERDTINLLVDEQGTIEGKVINSFLKSINEIINYKELQINKIIRYKDVEVSLIVQDQAQAKKEIVAQYDAKIEELVSKYLAREKNIVAESNKRLMAIVKDKDQEFEEKFALFKRDMEKNVLQKEEELRKAEIVRVEEVKKTLKLKDDEIKQISQQQVIFVEDLVAQKDQEINGLNDKYNGLLAEKDQQLRILSDSLNRIYASKWFKFREWLRIYLKI